MVGLLDEFNCIKNSIKLRLLIAYLPIRLSKLINFPQFRNTCHRCLTFISRKITHVTLPIDSLNK